MRRLLLCALAAAASLAGTAGWGQSVNVDLDAFFGPPRRTGVGVPSPAFGAAADQPGVWNLVEVTARGPIRLLGLDGRFTPVTYSSWGGIGYGAGWLNPRVGLGEANDDFWLLMGDAGLTGVVGVSHQLFPPVPIRVILFEGLEPGLYEVYTYCVAPYEDRYVPVEVTVPGALTENPQLSTGRMPPDWQFRRGITHALHRVWCIGGVIEVEVLAPSNPQYWPHSWVNGLQLKKLK